jgi:DNA primase
VNNHLKKEFSNSELTRAGLISDKGNLIFFNHRIMIPYLYKNTIVYLRGRYFDQDNQTVKEAMMKYLGIKNDAVNVNGSRRFYNIDTLNSCHEGRELYITEGEFDTMMIEQNMFPSVAIPGAGNTPNEVQLNKLLPYKLLVVADNDEAGMRLLQGLKLHFSKHNKIINRVELPSNSKDVSDWYMAG